MTGVTRPALDPATVEPIHGTRYPEKFAGPAAQREKRALGEALGLSKVGVNLTRLPPGTSSSQRHWHSQQDEFVFVVSGEAVLVTDAGEQTLTSGGLGRRAPVCQSVRVRIGLSGNERPHAR